MLLCNLTIEDDACAGRLLVEIGHSWDALDVVVTLTRGQTSYEGPSDVHVVGRNASSTQPAKFLVVFIKKAGAPIPTVEP